MKTFRTRIQSTGLRILGGAVALVWLADGATASDVFQMYEPSFLRHAERALEYGEPARAIGILEKHLESFQKVQHRAEAFGLMCRAELAQDNATGARAACRRAIELRPTLRSWSNWNNLGVAELRLQNYDAALEAFEKATALSGWSPIPRRNEGLLRAFLDGRESTGLAVIPADSH